jgi:hypothetical protein
MRKAGMLAVLLLGLSWTLVALAQQAGELEGTVTLRGGQTLTGKIQLAELGVVEGAGIGNSLPGHGALVVKVGDRTERIAGDDVASIEVEWVNAGTEAEPRWEIKKLTVVKRDKTKVEGTPDWLLHTTNVWVVTPEGQTQRVHVFPFGGETFSADDLLAKVTIGPGAPVAEAGPGAAGEQKAPAEAPPAPAQGEGAAAAAAPAPAAAAATAAPTVPAAPAPAPAPAAGEAAPGAAPAAPAPAPGLAAQTATGPLLARDALVIVVRCPKCGTPIKVIITADVVKVEHLAPEEP